MACVYSSGPRVVVDVFRAGTGRNISKTLWHELKQEVTQSRKVAEKHDAEKAMSSLATKIGLDPKEASKKFVEQKPTEGTVEIVKKLANLPKSELMSFGSEMHFRSHFVNLSQNEVWAACRIAEYRDGRYRSVEGVQQVQAKHEEAPEVVPHLNELINNHAKSGEVVAMTEDNAVFVTKDKDLVRVFKSGKGYSVWRIRYLNDADGEGVPTKFDGFSVVGRVEEVPAESLTSEVAALLK